MKKNESIFFKEGRLAYSQRRDSVELIEHSPGLSKRELFAALAMQGMWANPESITALLKICEIPDQVTGADAIAILARRASDALIKALEQNNE